MFDPLLKGISLGIPKRILLKAGTTSKAWSCIDQTYLKSKDCLAFSAVKIVVDCNKKER